MTDPKLSVPFTESDFDLSLFDDLMTPASTPAQDTEPPQDFRLPWQGVLEIERDAPPLGTGSDRTPMVFLSADQAEGDVWWSGNALGDLQAVMDQDEAARAQSAGHEFVVIEGIERSVVRGLGAQLTRLGLPETTISAVLMDTQLRLSPLPELAGRAMSELARYRMREDASALARVSGAPEDWPLLVQPTP